MSVRNNAMRRCLALTVASLGCTSTKIVPAADQQSAAERAQASMSTAASAPQMQGLPADAAGALARLNSSPRHGEWVAIRTGGGDSVRAWVVYPERSTKAP